MLVELVAPIVNSIKAISLLSSVDSIDVKFILTEAFVRVQFNIVDPIPVKCADVFVYDKLLFLKILKFLISIKMFSSFVLLMIFDIPDT